MKKCFNPQHIDDVRKVIASDCHVMHDKIRTILNISRTLVHLTLHNHLKMKKKGVPYGSLPYNLSQAEKNAQVQSHQENLKFNECLTCNENKLDLFL